MSATRTGGPEVVTFGCRLNAFESEVMKLQQSGDNNLVVFNTCAVTSEAVRQARQSIRKMRRERPDARIVVTGCAAQVDPDLFAAMPEVDRVLGNEEKLEPDALAASLKMNEKVRVNDIMSVKETAPQLLDGFGERARAFVQVQTGCDHRCTFCIIPYGRGNSRSVPMGAVVDQIKRLVDQGYNEVVLTGVDITSFGADLPASPSLGQLVQKILKLVPDLPRLRLSSIDSIEVDGPLMDAITGDARLMPHLHLSLQAGDDLVLKRMKRRHLRDDAIRFCHDVRSKRPDIVFGADIIAGFPTETEEQFQNSLRLVDECGLTWLHVFPYSEREGTPAAKMPPVEKRIRKERAERLRLHGNQKAEAYLASRIGQVERVLVETGTEGHSEGFAPVQWAKVLPAGRIVDIRVTGAENGKLIGELVD